MNSKQCRSAFWGRGFLMVGVLILSASLAFARSPKMAKDLEGKRPSDQVDVIVQFAQAPTAKQHQKVFDRGGKLRRELGLIKSGSYSMPASALADLAADPDVSYISPDRQLSSTATGSSTPVLDYHTDTVNAPVAWAKGLDGTGIGVAVIDSGIVNIPDLPGSGVLFSQNFVSGTPSSSTTDQYGHGTHVAGSSVETVETPTERHPSNTHLRALPPTRTLSTFGYSTRMEEVPTVR